MPFRKVRQRRKERGLCTVCGKRPLVTISYCEECRISENNYKKTRWKVRYREAKSQGKCTRCFYNLPRTGMATCIECSQKAKRQHGKLKAQGKCPRCCKRNYGSGIYCSQCRENVYYKAKSEGKCISCSNQAKARKVRCETCTESAASRGSIIGWINKFHLYLKMGGKCAMCGNLNLRVLVIDHVQYYNHHIANNGKIWNTFMLRMRQSSIKRTEILQGYKEGKYQLLCPNCNRLKELKRTGCNPYIQLAVMGKYYSGDQRSYSWFNKFTFLNQIGGSCFNCGINDLAVLEIHHVELFSHSKNEKEWESIRVKLRRNKTYRSMILQGIKEGKYSILCCNCNKIEAQKQVRSEPYIQQALIQLDRLNINNCVRDTSENNQDVLQIIQLNIVTCILYLFILFCFYRYTKFDVL
jgi:hypothetical protein